MCCYKSLINNEIHEMIEGEINQILTDMDKEWAHVVAEPVEVEDEQEDTNS